MKKSLHKLLFCSLMLLSATSFSQNQVYWKEGFQPDATPACDLGTVAPTTTGGAYFNGNAGVWYGFNVYRTTGTGCPAGNPHVRYKNISGVTDSGYLVTPIVSAGINELHFLRARASRSYTVWVTNDTLATTTNWIPVTLAKSSAATTTCVDTTVIVNMASAKRLKLVCRPGTDTDIDSFYITSVGVITPVKFAGINASVANNVVKLNWSIETELGINSYVIERAINADNFSAIGSLEAKKAGKYAWVDNAPNSGVNYYRIKALENDGKLSYSNVIKISTDKANTSVAVYPNPVSNGKLNVQVSGINKGNYTANFYNMNGALVHTTVIVSEGTTIARTIDLPATVKTGNYSAGNGGGR